MSVLRHPEYTRNRIAQITQRFAQRFYRETLTIEQVQVSERTDRIPLNDAKRLTYRPASVGERFGPLFATYWFKLHASVPKAWKDERVELQWRTNSESTLWFGDRSIQGLNQGRGGMRTNAMLLESASGGEEIEMYLEMACNGLFGAGEKNHNLPEHHLPFMFEYARLGQFDPVAWDMYHDLLVLSSLEREQQEPGDLDKTWGGRLLFELNRFCNEIDEADRDTWPAAGAILKQLLEHTNGSCVHDLSAIGHAHIDSAWLWPQAETVRKCIRSFSTATHYMQRYPEYKFACSQAWQYASIRQVNPDLYRRIKAAAKRGQWVPVGGTWIEPDCNLPSGESLCRQFLFGQRFFEREFGRRCKEFWNPDVFGYNGQLPQIMRQAGIQRFLTQKLSWNVFNQPMHHTFHWEGIDGSSVLAHFPPADSYNALCEIAEMRRHARNYKENDRSSDAFYLFGYGDGGGGPTETMLEVLRRTHDLQGVPRSEIRSSDEFFERLENNTVDVPSVVGELYFELHRGTYTSQARTKRGNRQNEWLLHDLEALAAIASRLGTHDYPRRTLNDLWELLLFNQFHDVLPGSSIRQVYVDAEADHAKIASAALPMRQRAAEAFAEASDSVGMASRYAGPTPLNTTSFARDEVAVDPGGRLVWVTAGGYGVGQVCEAPDSVRIVRTPKHVTLENAELKAALSADGRLLSLVHKATGRETMAAPGNTLQLFDDQPTDWGAWDVDPFHLETGRPCTQAVKYEVACEEVLRAEVRFERPVGAASKMTQTVRLDAGSKWLTFDTHVDWHESKKMLKVSFPLDVRAMTATYDMQFGSVERPTHYNDSQALAKFEVCGHKWADLSEHGFGAALLSESKYGFSAHGNILSMSLLRSTKTPDPEADMGEQHFAYAVYPHEGTWQQGQVVEAGYRFNVPLLWAQRGGRPHSFFSIEQDQLVLDTVKQSEDDDALVLRLYEPHGSRGKARLNFGLPVKSVVRCNTLEDERDVVAIENDAIELSFGPYELISLKLR